MVFRKDLQIKFNWLVAVLSVGLGFAVLFTVSCNAQPPKDTADLISLRKIMRDGKLPAESVAANIESRFKGTKTGALARLLRARIRLENGDPNGAAEILNSRVFAQKTSVADYALWLRGKALLNANQTLLAEKVFAELAQKYPGSTRTRESRLLLAKGLIKRGWHQKMISVLRPLIDKNDPEALLLAAKGYEKKSDQMYAVKFYRKVYFYGAGTQVGTEAELWLKEQEAGLDPGTFEEIQVRADNLFRKTLYREAAYAYDKFSRTYPVEVTPSVQLKRLTALARSGQTAKARSVFNTISLSAKEKEEAFYQLALGFAKARQWDHALHTVNEMRRKFLRSSWTPKAFIDVGMVARSQRRKPDELFLLRTAVNFYPNSIDVTKAQFELAWLEHQKKNYQVSSRMLTEHLARYVDKDNSYRGRAGYWAARDSEKAGKTDEACALYNALVYRYSANWYGYLGLKRLEIMRRNRRCQKPGSFPPNSLIAKAVANMRVVTVTAHTATAKELERSKKSEELGIVGLFDWAIDELEEARKTASNDPKINLALATHYRLKGDNVRALLALAKSYPDYSQMFPEEMGREEWDIFYPLIRWTDIKFWAKKRRLDPFNVAGLIRQETIFEPDAKSRANAYGLMQLLVPTARTMARKYSNTDSSSIYGSTLFNPSLNIELGTAYMREQLSKYGRIEYMSVAYNAGPGRLVRWRKKLPVQIDEFVEEIPFRETRGYVKGIIRNSAQYRRLYNTDGKFKSNIGTKPLRKQLESKPAEQFAKDNPDVLVKQTIKVTG